MEEKRAFGRLPGGETVHALTIGADALEVTLLSLGARFADMRFRTRDGWQRVILGFPDLAGFVAPNSRYFGAVVGRCANRIGGGRFSLDGRTYTLPLNERGRTHLHGGTIGFSGQVWRVAEHTPTVAAFALTSPDGDEGYPGTVEATCRYQVTGSAELSVVLSATIDRPSPVNLACHPFFDLDGNGDIRDHELEICAESRTPVDADKIPTGAIIPVSETEWDFRLARPIRSETHFDDNFVTGSAPVAEPRRVATLTGAKTRIRLDLLSTEPGLQFYDGSVLAVTEPGFEGRRYGPFSGLALEPQLFPDSPNHPEFTDAILRPGEHYRQHTIYRFSQTL
ncbi:MAG: galactose mutarotase [Acetobacteraceae bacterium]|nr:galactose mutarotase [Acetobacteraceae bacterium]